jgi:hypothetical protein
MADNCKHETCHKFQRESLKCELVGFDMGDNTITLQLPSLQSFGGAVIGQAMLVSAITEEQNTRILKEGQ